MFSIFTRIQKVMCYILSILLGKETCLICGASCFVRPICPKCYENFVNFSLKNLSIYKMCKICGKSVFGSSELCTECRGKPILTYPDSVKALYPYRLWYKDLLFTWKIEGVRSLSPMFAEAIYNAMRSTYNGSLPPIVPVPPRLNKIRKIGWDQIEDICFILKKNYNCTILPLLKRISSEQQKNKSRLERYNSWGKDYKISCKAEKIIAKYKGVLNQVVLIDDVITTGITIDTCSFLLKSCGIRKVQVISLFRVD